MSFAAPLLLVSLALVPLAMLGHGLWSARRPSEGVPHPDLDLVAAAAPPPRRRRHLPLILALLALVALALALGRPQAWRDQPRERATIMLAIDVSGSMAANDVAPDRLRAAQDAAKAFADEVPAQYRVGLVTFSGVARVIVPPTTDRVALARAVAALAPEGATAIGDAVQAALAAIDEAGDPPPGFPGDPSASPPPAARILLLSDGASTQGTLTAQAAAEAREAGVPVFTVALGTDSAVLPNGTRVPPEPRALAALAETTGGRSYESPDAASVREVYARLGSFIGTERVRGEVTGWFAGAGAALIALAGLAAWRFGPRLG